MSIYAVIDRPGYFGSNRSPVRSTHKSLRMAQRASTRHVFFSPDGARHNSSMIVLAEGKKRGDCFWGDAMPEAVKQ